MPPKKQVVKIRKTESDSDTDGVKNTLAQDCKMFNCKCSLHVSHSHLSQRNIYNCFYGLGLQKRNTYVDAIHGCTSANARHFSTVAFRLITHFYEIFESSWRFPDIAWCPTDVILVSLAQLNAVGRCGISSSTLTSPGTIRCLNK